MHIERYGQGEKILFIHGSGWNTHMWYGQRDYLASSMEVILIDLPGHGESPGNSCKTIEEYRDAVYETMKKHGIERPYIAGHSLGGAVAQSLSLTYPDSVKGIILVGTGARLRVLPHILEGIINDTENTIKNITEVAFSPKTSQTLKNEAFDEMMKCRAEVTSHDFHACDGFNIMESVSSITTPALIICGTDDALTPPKYSLYLNKTIKDSRLVFVEDAGHMVMMEKPAEVNSTIEEFVKNEQIFVG
jgi:pimeloyl-ACP methyl ester carboxylesterase